MKKLPIALQLYSLSLDDSIEQEAHPWSRLETVERCLKAMRAIGK
jgi:hypothetical protein